MKRCRLAPAEKTSGHASIDTRGFQFATHHGAGRNNAAGADRRPIKHAHARAEPDIVADTDAALAHRLAGDKTSVERRAVICRYDHTMRGDADIVADLESAMAVKNAVGIDAAAFAQPDGPSIRQQHRARVDDRARADFDGAAIFAADLRAGHDDGALPDLDARHSGTG